MSKMASSRSRSTDIDQGYAWVVLFAAVTLNMIESTNALVGIFLVEFRHHFNITNAAVSMVGMLQICVGQISGQCETNLWLVWDKAEVSVGQSWG